MEKYLDFTLLEDGWWWDAQNIHVYPLFREPAVSLVHCNYTMVSKLIWPSSIQYVLETATCIEVVRHSIKYRCYNLRQ